MLRSAVLHMHNLQHKTILYKHLRKRTPLTTPLSPLRCLHATPTQIAAAEARGRRAGMLDKEIAEATIKQQLQVIAEEKEVVSRHRLSAELLAQLTEKVRRSRHSTNVTDGYRARGPRGIAVSAAGARVAKALHLFAPQTSPASRCLDIRLPQPRHAQVRSVAVSSIEREERALSVLERDVQDREGRLAAREKLLAEREGRIAAREREVDELRANLQVRARHVTACLQRGTWQTGDSRSTTRFRVCDVGIIVKWPLGYSSPTTNTHTHTHTHTHPHIDTEPDGHTGEQRRARPRGPQARAAAPVARVGACGGGHVVAGGGARRPAHTGAAAKDRGNAGLSRVCHACLWSWCRTS